MNQAIIAQRKRKTAAAIARTGHALEVVYAGGAHVRYYCTKCFLQFKIDEYHPPEAPGYWDDNNWQPCQPKEES
jgi:hypothetical protein